MFAVSSRRVLPGFTLSLGTSLLFVCLILLLPLSALVMQLAMTTVIMPLYVGSVYAAWKQMFAHRRQRVPPPVAEHIFEA